jgi:hypothetical protein
MVAYDCCFRKLKRRDWLRSRSGWDEKHRKNLAAVAKPDILLAWYRKLIANQFDGSKFRQRVGRLTALLPRQFAVVQMAKENPSCGYDRIVGTLAILSFLLSDHQTVGNILDRHGLSPAPKRKQAVPLPSDLAR